MISWDPDWHEVRLLSDHIATQLYADLRAGRLAVVSIGEIEAACDAAIAGGRIDPLRRERLLQLVCRRVVEKASELASWRLVQPARHANAARVIGPPRGR